MSEEGMSERGRELAVRAVKESDDKVLEDLRQRLSTRIDEVGRLEAEVAELRKRLRNIETLEEELAIRVREFLDAERQVVEGWNENAELRKERQQEFDIATGYYRQAVELRERVGQLEGALKRNNESITTLSDIICDRENAGSACSTDEFAHEVLRDMENRTQGALSPASAQAKSETRSEAE